MERYAVDLLIATVADTIERRKVATIIEPGYYAGGVTVMLRPDQRFTDWAALRGKSVCATQGAYYNRPMSERYLLTLVTFRDTRDALLGLRDGRCVGYLYTNSAIESFLKKEEWAGYHAPLPRAMVTPWGMVISRHESGTDFEQRLGNIAAEWHRSGFLIEREQAWKIRPSEYLRKTQAQWTAREADGSYQCKRGADGNWPVICRNAAIITSKDVTGLQNLGLLLKEKTGIDLSFLYDPYDRSRFARGLLITIVMMFACVAVSLAFGLPWAILADSRSRWLAGTARAVAIHARMTPPLLQMYLLFFGVGGVIFAKWGISIYPMLVAVFCMSYYTGGGIMASVLDMARHRRESEPGFRLAWNNVVETTIMARGPVFGSLINVMKQTVMASAIAVPELLSVSLAIMADQGNINVMMNVLVLTYLLLITLAIKLLNRLQRRLDVWVAAR